MTSFFAQIVHQFAGVIGLYAMRAAVDRIRPVLGCVGRAQTIHVDLRRD
jgi:hypothetical protein